MKKHLKKVVVISSLALATVAVVSSRQNSPENKSDELPVTAVSNGSHQDLWAANDSNSRRGRSALPPVRGRARTTPVQIKSPFESELDQSLRKRSGGKGKVQKQKSRKPINPKEEFMPDITDIPTASQEPVVSPQPIKQQSRWIKELSGRSARIQMAAARKKVDACDEDHLAACAERREASVTLAGVVMHTDAQVNGDPAMPRLEGEMARGSYVEDKPFVYLK